MPGQNLRWAAAVLKSFLFFLLKTLDNSGFMVYSRDIEKKSTFKEDFKMMVMGWREQMISKVISRYGFENKNTVQFFEALRTGNDEKIIKTYHKIMKGEE